MEPSRHVALSRFTFEHGLAAEPMAPHELDAAERLLARLIANAIGADHPDLLKPHPITAVETEFSGSPSTARAEAGAPPASGGDSDQHWSVEQDEDDAGGAAD